MNSAGARESQLLHKIRSEDFLWVYSENTAGLKQRNEVNEFLWGRLLLPLMGMDCSLARMKEEGSVERL